MYELRNALADPVSHISLNSQNKGFLVVIDKKVDHALYYLKNVSRQQISCSRHHHALWTSSSVQFSTIPMHRNLIATKVLSPQLSRFSLLFDGRGFEK